MKKLLLFMIACTLGLFGTLRAQETLFYDDFEDASAFEANWNLFQGSTATGANWQRGSGSLCGGYGDSYAVYSASYTTSNVQCDNYIITKNAYLISETSEIQWYVTHSAYNYAPSDGYYVTISEDGTNYVHVSDQLTCKAGEAEQAFSLADYAGKTIYVGFHHTGWGGEFLKLDNIRLTGGASGEGGEEPETPVDPEPEQPNDGYQDIIAEVGANMNPSASNNYNIPAYDYNAYSVSQQIYLAEELGGMVGEINSVSFKFGVYTRQPITRQYEVYLTHTDLEVFNEYNFVAVSESDKVFDGDVYLEGTADTWFTIEFDKAFNYEGGNFILTVYDKSGVSAGNDYHYFYRYLTTKRALLWKNGPYDIYNMTGTGTSMAYVNQLQLGMTVSTTPTVPQNLVAVATGASTIALSWNTVGVATSYNVYSNGQLLANVEGTTYTVEGLTADTEYCYTVAAVNGELVSDASTAACAKTTAPAPSAPTGLVATADATTIALSWNAAETAVSYNIYKGTDVIATAVTETTYNVQDLTPETEYCFTVTAVNAGGESAASEAVCATTLEFTGCYVIFTLKDSYGDGWYQDKLVVSYDGITKDLVFTENSNAKTKEYVLGIPQDAHVTVVYQAGVQYSYPAEESIVIAYESGREIYSLATLSNGCNFEFDVNCAPAVPDKPVVVAKATGESTIELTVTAVGADSYTIYQGTEVLAAGLTEATYTVEGLTADTEYCFTVKSTNEVGESEVSEAACATTYKAGTAIVQIGDETSALYGYYAPVSNMGYYAKYSLSQQIYYKEELGGEPCAITSVSFQNYSGGPNTRNIVVYMTNVDDAKDTFEGGAGDWVVVSEADIVYQGQHTFGVQGDWTTIEFETPFIYRGKNVCITVNDLTGVTKEYSGYDMFYVTATENIRGIYATNQTSQFDCSNLTAAAIVLQNQDYDYNTGSYTYTKYIVNAKLRTEPAEVEALPLPSTPANLVAESTGISSIALTWDAAENAATYNVYQGEELIATNLVTTSYAVEGLADDTEYCFTVTAVNLEGESEASEQACATTDDFDGCFVVFTLKDTYGDGWTGNYLEVKYGETTETLGFSVADFNYKEYSKEYVLPLAIGTNVTVSFVVPSTGTWPSENGFVVSYQGGEEIINVATGTFVDNNVGTFTYDTFVVNCGDETEEPVEPALPAAPANVVATADGQNSIVVTWDAVEGATDYYVYKDGEMWANTNGATTYTENGLVMGTEYCFAVQTVAGNLESELSEEACATTESLPENQVLVGTATTKFYSPFLTILQSADRWFEAIYRAEEIGKAGMIEQIAFSYNMGAQTTADIKIYFAEVEKTVFGNPNDFTAEGDLALVYSGTGVTLCDSEWETFVLDNSFNYSGEKNLLVVVSTSNTSGSNQWNCYSEANSVVIKDYGLSDKKPVLMLTLAEEGGNDEPVDDTKYRLVSTGVDYNALEYVYESETSNKVIEIRKGVNYGYGQDITFLQYDENGVLTGYEYGWAENGEIVKSGSSYQYTDVEYTYTEGVLTAYTETQYTGWAEPDATEYTITRDAEGNITEVAYGTSKVVYTYENGKLVNEVKSYYNQWAETPGYETEYEIEYTYDENGNCTVATQYSTYSGERIARNATEYVYATTIPAENVVAFAYPHAVAPAHANLIAKAISYEFREDYNTGEITKDYFTVTPYVYNPEVVSEPLAPMGLTVDAVSDTELVLSWVAVESAEKFYIYKGEEFFAESETTTYNVTGLESATEYCFSVSGVNGELESPKSEVVCGKTLGLVAFYPAELEFGEVRVGNYWAKEETTASVEINTLGKTITAITCDNAFFTVPANIDLTASYIMFELGYDKTAEAGEYTGNIVVTLEGGATVAAPVTATAYAPAVADVFELAQEITFVDGVYTDTPDFATLHDDYLMPEEYEWNDGKLMDAVYTFTLETPSAVTVKVAGENAQYAIYKAEGFEYPTEETFNGIDRAITTAFSFDFNDGELGAFTIKDYDQYQEYTWDVEDDGNGGYKLVSYSYNGWYDENNQWVYIADADERIITNEAFNITEKSVLTFNMNVNGSFESVIVEVTKDGETFTAIETVGDNSYSYEWLAKRVNIGEKLAELGLEYGEYRISLYHDVQGYGELNIDNLVLAERELAFPEGTYFLFAAAEKDLAVEVSVVETEEVVIVPEAKAYRLESVESFMTTVYTYDEVFTNRVVEMVEEGITTTLSYNKAGQVVSAAQVVVYEGEEGEEGEPVEEVLSSIEYTYNEDGTLATYTETAPTPMGAMATTTTEYTYEDGRLVKAENADYEIEMTYVYNEDGTVKEIVEPYMTTVFTYENGNLVKTTIGWNDEETGEFFAEAEEVYTYANGNVVKQESYEYGSLYQVHEFFYDATVAAEDVYTFELPHMALTNVEPVSNNVLVKELSYYSYYDEEADETIVHSYTMTVYNYNPAIEMAPITPINFAAEVVDGVVELTWEALADAETFTVYQDGEVIADDVTEGFYAVEGLAAGEYCFVVRAYNAAGASASTNDACVTIEGGEPTPTVPAAPVVRVAEVTATTIVLEWDAVEGATEYAVYFEGEKLGTLAGTIAGIQDLEPETTYCFTVTAINEVGESAHSEKVCATTLKGEGIAENATALNIYPNPAVDRVVIETEATIEAVSIYTLTGVMIYSEVDFNNNTINVSDFASGVYVMKVRTENGEVVKRFIKK